MRVRVGLAEVRGGEGAHNGDAGVVGACSDGEVWGLGCGFWPYFYFSWWVGVTMPSFWKFYLLGNEWVRGFWRVQGA